MSTQLVPHKLVGALHLQAPAVQLCPVRQALPQLPQFCTLLLVSTQLPPHCLVPVWQVLAQLPAEHTVPVAHTLPQTPQLAESVCRSTH
jgi:hypothetical protein